MSVPGIVTWDCSQCSYSITDEADIVDEARQEHQIGHTIAGLGGEMLDDDDERGPDREPAVRTAEPGPRWREWSEDQVVESLQTFAAELKKTPTSTDWLKASHERPSLNTIKRIFGSWSQALLAAGLEIPSRGGRRPAAESNGHALPAGLKTASGDLDLVAAAQFVKKCRQELVSLERKRETTEALLHEALETLNDAVQREIEEVGS